MEVSQASQSAGGLPNGTVDADTLASNAVTNAKIASLVQTNIVITICWYLVQQL